ncbi:MAG: DUF6911 family protein [Nitrospirota bacterium]
MSMGISWVIGSGEQRTGGDKRETSLIEIISLINKAWDCNGVVELYKHPCPDIGAQNIQVRIDKHRSVLTLGEENVDDHDVRAYTNPIGQPGVMVEILGDYWGEQMVCDDLDVVIECFKQFWETGDVSPDLLN